MISDYVHQQIQGRWREVLWKGWEELPRLYDTAGEGAAHGTYARRLFRRIREQLERAGFRTTPGFPGTLATSREWGAPEERGRW